ncbi:PAT family beta-lactamase induction signal transducer AmpG [Spirosoma oryzae]|uniref:PAT family beta-lactamase induction signal transducer AmpG n=1 Tax=Spirosoma oryzae TaxID=1469603 RepID=A0A2T0T387_9BACT|nr:MFS transporter [Spirosoma oryzae]PRY40101.1 PAT family beta-lactamase induction signal transducer AmpG [Spirosoma oryzae]
MTLPTLTLSQRRSLRYGTFFYLYVMQGLPSGFALTAVTNYLAAEGLTPQALGSFGAIVGLPWGFKFVWGPFVDRLQASAMGRRRPWVLAAQLMALIASVGIIFIRDPVSQFSALAIAFSLHGVFASLQDVSVDALAISTVAVAERGRVNAFMKGGMVVGQAIGAAGLAYLIRNGSFQLAAIAQSVTLLAFTVLTFFIREQPGDAFVSFKRRIVTPTPAPGKLPVTRPDWSFGPLLRTLLRAILLPRPLLIFGAIALVFIGERLFQRAFNIHLIQQLGWTDTDVSVLSGTYGTLLAVLLALLGGWLADTVGAQRMLLGTTLGMAILHIGYALAASSWNDPTVATAGLVVRQSLEPIFSIAALPMLMSLCQRGIEGSQFAFYMAISNQADVIGIFLAGQLQPMITTSTLGIGCGVAMLVAAVVLRKTVHQPNAQASPAS